MEVINESLVAKAYVGSYEVFSNGLVPHEATMPLKIILQDLTLAFNFIEDKDVTKKEVTRRVVDDKNLIFDMVNFTNTLGSGIITPWEIGYINNRKLFISVWVWSPNPSDNRRLINWTLMLGDKISNNE